MAFSLSGRRGKMPETGEKGPVASGLAWGYLNCYNMKKESKMMKRKWIALALSGALFCMLSGPALAAEDESSKQSEQTLPDSVLYYGEVKDLLTAEDGTLTGLHMDSERSGEYVMQVSEDTCWIDSGKRTASTPGAEEGERLYVFHSPVSTRSMPPQSAAFAVVRNVPQDAGSAQYHKVEAVEQTEDGKLQITTDNGGLYLFADDSTTFSAYGGGSAQAGQIKAGDHIMAWYGVVAMSYPGRAHVSHIMTLDRTVQEPELMTRAAFLTMLHTAQGSPAAGSSEADFLDVDGDATYAEAVRWASSEGILSGYGDGRMGPDDMLSREQLVTMLWRQAGSPALMDYPGLTNYSDAADISRYAQPALAWAHQRGLISAGGELKPLEGVTSAEAEEMLRALQ